MRPYITTSSGKRTGLHVLVVTAYAAGILLVSSSSTFVPFAPLWQLVGVLLLVAGVYLTTRYSLRSYTYAVEPGDILDADGEAVYELVITEAIGRKRTVVARVALRDIDADGLQVVRQGETAVRRDEASPTPRVLRYANTPVVAVAIHVPVPEEGSILVLPYDEGLLAAIRTAAR